MQLAGGNLPLGKCSCRERLPHGRVGGDGDHALGGNTAAAGMGNADSRRERRAATCRRSVTSRRATLQRTTVFRGTKRRGLQLARHH